MNKDIAGLILNQKYWAKSTNIPKSKWRKYIADKFLKTEKYISRTWTVNDFIETYNELELLGMIK